MGIIQLLGWLSVTTLQAILADLQGAMGQVDTDQQRVDVVAIANLVRREL
ncbi:MAG: hypothetical protein AAF629_00030 [Chloroflexota bacterium]